MALRIAGVLMFAVITVGFLSAATPVAFNVSEPITIVGVPPVTLGPGTYIIQTLDSSGGANVVQILSKQKNYVYTTVLTIPATRLRPEDNAQVLFSETPSGTPPALHFWFPPGESRGYEFVNPGTVSIADRGTAPAQLQLRADKNRNQPGHLQGIPADFHALREALLQIENGKFRAARDYFRRNYFLGNSREGAITSFLLALLMTDRKEARESLLVVNRLDPERARVLSKLDVNGVVESLPNARSDLKASLVRRFLLNFALEMTDDAIARNAIVSFERHAIKGDSLPVEMALDRRREEREKERRREDRWVLAKEQIARLSDCVKSLLNQVGALEYSASLDAKFGESGSVRVRIVLTQRRLNDLDAIVHRSHRTICERRSRLERIVAQGNPAVARELDSIRSALNELDRQPGSSTRSQFASLRNWETAPASGVSRDLTILAEMANLPYMRPSSVFRTNRGYVQLNIAGSLARLAEWTGL